ncbi:MAG: STAS domain-containing protein [Acidimicrobiales bacterium]|nr:STAS domain-containing protein [Acidimicrobiales bacterium]
MLSAPGARPVEFARRSPISAPAPRMVWATPPTTRIRLAGALTARTAEELRRRVREAAPGDAVIDLTGVTEIDQCGIGAVLGAIRAVRGGGGQVAVVVGAQHHRRLAEHGVGRLARLRIGAGSCD